MQTINYVSADSFVFGRFQLHVIQKGYSCSMNIYCNVMYHLQANQIHLTLKEITTFDETSNPTFLLDLTQEDPEITQKLSH